MSVRIKGLSVWLSVSVIITCDFICDFCAVSRVFISGSQREECYRLLVLGDLQAVVHPAKNWAVVILIQHCDLDRRFGEIWRESAILGIHCWKKCYWLNVNIASVERRDGIKNQIHSVEKELWSKNTQKMKVMERTCTSHNIHKLGEWMLSWQASVKEPKVCFLSTILQICSCSLGVMLYLSECSVPGPLYPEL